MDISICICTFRRPGQLNRLLHELMAMDPVNASCELVIVDNDPAGSAHPILAEWATISSLPLVSLHVPTPNIALARNAAVHAATGQWIAIIDDDETPEGDWLRQLVETQRRYDADAVFGPVFPRFPADTPEWLRCAGVLDPHAYPTGTRMKSRDAYSGNALVRRDAMLRVPGPFDPEFGVTGGSDTMLFWEMERQGASFIWCADAIVSEEVPQSRLSLQWVLRRSYRGGQSFVRAEIARLTGGARLLRMLQLGTRAIFQLLAAAVLTVACAMISRTAAVRWLLRGAAQLGKLGALGGHRYREYAH